jgi:LPS O-antigen subunit length determinant protein (WzzB/FepE family)
LIIDIFIIFIIFDADTPLITPLIDIIDYIDTLYSHILILIIDAITAIAFAIMISLMPH